MNRTYLEAIQFAVDRMLMEYMTNSDDVYADSGVAGITMAITYIYGKSYIEVMNDITRDYVMATKILEKI